MASIRRICDNEDEFRAVVFALSKAGYLEGFIPERSIFTYKPCLEAKKIIQECVPSGHREGMGFTE